MEFAGLYHNSSRRRVATHIPELIGDTVWFEDVKWNLQACTRTPGEVGMLQLCEDLSSLEKYK